MRTRAIIFQRISPTSAQVFLGVLGAWQNFTLQPCQQSVAIEIHVYFLNKQKVE